MQRTCLLCALLFAIVLTEGRGQITLVGDATIGTDGFPPAVFLDPPDTDSLEVAGGLLLSLYDGDWQYVVPNVGPQSEQTIFVSAYQVFSVGPLPVRVNSLSLDANFKIVNGGGNSNWPKTSVLRRAVIFDAGGGPVILRTQGGVTDLTGNGLAIIDETTTSSQTPYILGGGLSYALQIDFLTTVQGPSENELVPRSSVTAEFGGISSFEGFTASFTYETVPEPQAAMLLASASGLLLGRRRR